MRLEGRYEFDVKLLDSYMKSVYGEDAFCVVNVCEETGLYRVRLAYENKYVELELESLDVLTVLVDFLHEAKVKAELLKICRDTLFGKNS